MNQSKIILYLSHPVKNAPPGNVEYLGSSVLTVFLGKESHLQLEGGGVGQILGLLLHVLILHPLHIQLLLPPGEGRSAYIKAHQTGSI